MMVAWAGMASGGYVGGVLFDLSLSYTLAFLVAAMAGVLNLAVIGAFATTKNVFVIPEIWKAANIGRRDHGSDIVLADRS
jgi:hypothetical protein